MLQLPPYPARRRNLQDISGIHWNNDPWSNPTEAEYAAAKPFHWVLQILHTYNGILDGEAHRARQFDHLKRLRQDRHELIYRIDCPPWEDPATSAANWLPILTALVMFGDRVVVNNEVNLNVEGWGGSGTRNALRYNRWFCGFADAIKGHLGDRIQIGFTPIWPDPAGSDLTWLSACEDSIRKSGFLAAHSYWESTHAQDIEQGRRYTLLANLAFGNPILVTEFGDATKDKSQEEKARSCREWLLDVQAWNKQHNATTRVEATCYFLLDSSDPRWQPFLLGHHLPILAEPIIIERKEQPATVVNTNTNADQPIDLRPAEPELFEAWEQTNGPDTAARKAFNLHAIKTGTQPTTEILLQLTEETKENVIDYTNIVKTHLSHP